MKYLALAIIAVLLVSSTVGAEDRSPVNVAHQLYEGCMGGYFLAANLKPSRAEIRQFIDGSKEQCLTWMVVWYKPVTGNVMKITEWSDDNLNKLDALIVKTNRNMDLEIRLMLGVK